MDDPKSAAVISRADRALFRIFALATFALAVACSGERNPSDVGTAGTGGQFVGKGGNSTGGATHGTGGGGAAGTPGTGGLVGGGGTTGTGSKPGTAGSSGTAGSAGSVGSAGNAGSAGSGGSAGSAGSAGHAGGSGGGATGGAGGTGRACGARAGATCTSDEYCAYVAGQYCGGADAEATCKHRPDACTLNYSPVCGCDGNTYSNACAANAAGTGVNTQAACASSAGN